MKQTAVQKVGNNAPRVAFVLLMAILVLGTLLIASLAWADEAEGQTESEGLALVTVSEVAIDEGVEIEESAVGEEAVMTPLAAPSLTWVELRPVKSPSPGFNVSFTSDSAGTFLARVYEPDNLTYEEYSFSMTVGYNHPSSFAFKGANLTGGAKRVEWQASNADGSSPWTEGSLPAWLAAPTITNLSIERVSETDFVLDFECDTACEYEFELTVAVTLPEDEAQFKLYSQSIAQGHNNIRVTMTDFLANGPSAKKLGFWTQYVPGEDVGDSTSISGLVIPAYQASLPVTYPVIEKPAPWTGSGTVTARIDADYEKFVRLLYQGVAVDTDSYTVSEGSTVITFAEDYLKTLENGTHTFTAEFTDGVSAPITLTVNVGSSGGGSGGSGEPGSVTNLPATGDATAWLAPAAVLFALLGAGLLRLRQSRQLG
jgi:hypothetical protein